MSSPAPFREPYREPPPAPKPFSTGQMLAALVLVSVALPAGYCLEARRLVPDALALGGWGLLLALTVALYRRPGGDATPPAWGRVGKGPLDKLAVVWLLSPLFSPLLGLVLSCFTLTEGNWPVLLGLRALLCVAVPVLCVAPLLRYLGGPGSLTSALVLFTVTAFPVLFGLRPAYDWCFGPAWQTVEVRALRGEAGGPRNHRTYARDVFAELADGRTLRRSGELPWHLGANRLLVLRGVEQAIALAPVAP